MFKDKDPAIYALRAALEKDFGVSRLTSRHFRTMRYDGGPTVSTQDNLFYGDTMKPMNKTIDSIAASRGLKRVFVADDKVLPPTQRLNKWRRDLSIPEPRGYINGTHDSKLTVKPKR